MTRHDRVGKVIHCVVCKKLKFEFTAKRYMQKLESIQVNETLKILRDFEIKSDPLILAWRPEPRDKKRK